MIMRLIWFIAFLSATFSFHNVYADTRCEVVDVSQRVLGVCRTLLFKRYVATTAVGFHSEVGQVIDLLVPRADNPQIKRACMLQIDGSNVPCDTVWYISFKDGAQSIQFNRGSGQNPIFSSSSELRLLHLNKFTIVRWIEVEKRSTRSKMLHENLSDHPGAARGHRWHGQCANRRSYYGHALHEAGHGGRSGCWDHRSR